MASVPARAPKDLMKLRKEHLFPSMCTSYSSEPLKIVKGRGQYLYDETGKQYLDIVNNVCTVGHCHPNVVKAVQDQVAELNTNSRYLHDTIVQYAMELGQKFPEPLRVCVFVNSGSEANELALRIARAYTGEKDLLVLDGAYHGNTTTLVEISPYKYEGKGGFTPPETTHKVMLPDTYRGPYKADNPNAVSLYVDDISRAIKEVKAAGRGITGFLAESFPSCAGQVPLPPGYLKEAYKVVRAAGGLCIADECQTGYGRSGDTYWAFQTQDVMPDIVTLGKPSGNGMPLGVVVTTHKIAAAFTKYKEFFSTFGGNPVCCAAGLAVLRAIDNDHLQENARVVGSYLLSELRKLKPKHTLIGDVRGFGLMIGIELVKNHQTLEPATAEASEVVMIMKSNGVLLSTDGPSETVLKIKGPLCLTRADVDLAVRELDKALSIVEAKSKARL